MASIFPEARSDRARGGRRAPGALARRAGAVTGWLRPGKLGLGDQRRARLGEFHAKSGARETFIQSRFSSSPTFLVGTPSRSAGVNRAGEDSLKRRV